MASLTNRLLGTRSLWVLCDRKSPIYALRELGNLAQADGTQKIMQKKYHEKPHRRRIRKKSESDIRRANRKIGTMISVIQKTTEARMASKDTTTR